MESEKISMQKLRWLFIPLTLFSSGCTIYIGPYEDDALAPDGEFPAQDLSADQQARKAEVDAHKDMLRSTYNIVAESEGYSSQPYAWGALGQGQEPPYSILDFLPWNPEDLLPSPGVELPRTELDLFPELQGPEGTTPILLPEFETYVMGETGASSLQDYLDNHQVFGMPADQDRLYAGLDSYEPNRGASATLNFMAGEVEDNSFSLMEVSVSCPQSGPALETIGVLISIDRKNFKSRLTAAEALQPRIHIEYIRQVNGKEKGVFDMNEPGFERFPYAWAISSDDFKLPGRTLLGGPVPVSVPGGTQVEHRVDIFQVPTGDWWIA